MLSDHGLELLTEEQCAWLLAAAPAGRLGRVGVTISGLPVILPVNFAYVHGDIVFRTSVGTKFDAATRNAIVAFEVDDYDSGAQTGWSVLVVGRASVVDNVDESAEYERMHLAPWANGDAHNFVRVHPEMVTGRRILD
jgi:nitroimidazol reductase NimA-like FMN-containing flavoprotein (pyridoxamine 5'-phosphate oxidase superfamily)